MDGNGPRGTRSPRTAPGGAPTWRERAAALRYVPALVKMVWGTIAAIPPRWSCCGCCGARPIATLWSASIIDVVVASLSTATRLSAPLEAARAEIGIVVTGEILARASSLYESLLGDSSPTWSGRLMRHAATLDLAQFEDPESTTHLERARRQTGGRIGLLTALLSMRRTR